MLKKCCNDIGVCFGMTAPNDVLVYNKAEWTDFTVE